MKRASRIKLIILGSLIISALIYANSRKDILISDEEPFISLKEPFKRVDVCLIMDGNKSVGMRIIDANGKEELLYALRHPAESKETIVLKNYGLEWSETWGGQFANIRGWNSIADIPSSVEVSKNPQHLLADMLTIAYSYCDKNSKPIEMAINALKEDHLERADRFKTLLTKLKPGK